MNFIKLFFSLLSTPFLRYNYNTATTKSGFDGCDDRFPIRKNNVTELVFSDEDHILLEKIGKYFLYKEFLNTLENDKVSIEYKLRIIEENNLLPPLDSYKYKTNLLAGGLMDDFNLDIQL